MPKVVLHFTNSFPRAGWTASVSAATQQVSHNVQSRPRRNCRFRSGSSCISGRVLTCLNGKSANSSNSSMIMDAELLDSQDSILCVRFAALCRSSFLCLPGFPPCINSLRSWVYSPWPLYLCLCLPSCLPIVACLWSQVKHSWFFISKFCSKPIFVYVWLPLKGSISRAFIALAYMRF